MNKKNLLYLILILIGATLLRLWHLDKPEGIWNDEYLTLRIANARLFTDFFTAINSNCHAPLHYLYLKLWIFIFKDTDTYLRLSSVVPGVLSIIVMFFAGLEFKKKDGSNVAVVAAFLTGISSFLIYFSQEIRIYSLLFFITSLVLLYALKIFNSPSKKNFFLYSLFSLLLVLTHTIGFVFVFLSTAALMVFAVPKKNTKDFLLFSILGVIVLALPFVPLISSILFKNGYFSQWWAPFNFSRTLFIFTDIFSPVLYDTFHVYNTFSDAFYKNGVINVGYLVFAIIPTLIGITCFVNGVLNPKKVQGYMLSVIICTVLVVLIAAMAGKIVFVTKYMIEILPLVILLTADGFCAFKSKAFKIAIATIFIVLNLFFFAVSKTSAVKLVREEGQKLPVVAIENLGLKKNDKIMFLYYPKEWFFRYIDFKNPDNAPYENAFGVSKYDYSYFLAKNLPHNESSYGIEEKNSLKPVFAHKENDFLDDWLDLRIFKELERGDKFFFVDLTSVSFFPMNVINDIASSKNTSSYDSAPLLYIVMSYVKGFTLEKAKKELVYGGYYNTGAWRIYVFEKV